MVRSLRVVQQPLGVAHIRGHVDTAVAGGVTAPFGGVVTFAVAVGDLVPEGSVVAIIEAMKLEAAITAPSGGRVARLAIRDQTQAEGGDLLLVIE